MLASKNGNLPLVELLLQTAANPNFENAAGKSASSIAGAAGHSEIVRLLQLYEASPKCTCCCVLFCFRWGAWVVMIVAFVWYPSVVHVGSSVRSATRENKWECRVENGTAS